MYLFPEIMTAQTMAYPGLALHTMRNGIDPPKKKVIVDGAIVKGFSLDDNLQTKFQEMDGLEFKPTTTYADQQIMMRICRVFMVDQNRFIEDLNVQKLCVFSLQ